MIVSTGMATLAELDELVRTVRLAGCKDLVLLKCTSTYPSSPENSNLLTIPHLREMFDCEVGLSDHTMGIGASLAAVALGASVIEKHLTLARADGGVDAVFSMEPPEMKALTTECLRAWQALGRIQYGPTEAERSSMIFRRSIYVTKDLSAGDVLSHENLRIIRPGYGAAPKDLPLLLGKHVNRDVKSGTPASFDLIG